MVKRKGGANERKERRSGQQQKKQKKKKQKRETINLGTINRSKHQGDKGGGATSSVPRKALGVVLIDRLEINVGLCHVPGLLEHVDRGCHITRQHLDPLPGTRHPVDTVDKEDPRLSV